MRRCVEGITESQRGQVPIGEDIVFTGGHFGVRASHFIRSFVLVYNIEEGGVKVNVRPCILGQQKEERHRPSRGKTDNGK